MSEPLFHCTVPGVPVPQGRMRHAKNRAGYYAKRSEAHRTLLRDTFGWERNNWPTTCTPPIDRPISLLIEIAGMRANSDASNHAKMIEDALVDAGVLASDDVCVVRELVVRVVSGEPRTAVTVTAL